MYFYIKKIVNCFVIILLLGMQGLYAQYSLAQKVYLQIDSLEALLNASNKQEDIKIMFQLASYYQITDTTMAIKYTSEALELAREYQDSIAIAEGYSLLGFLYNSPERSIPYLQKSAEWLLFTQPLQAAKNYLQISRIISFHRDFENYTQMLLCANKALEIFKKNPRTRLMAEAQNYIGEFYLYHQNAPLALTHFFKGYNEIKKDRDFSVPTVLLHNLAQIYKKQAKIDSARFFLVEAVNSAIKNNDLVNMQKSSQELSLFYAGQNEYQQAYVWQLKADSIQNIYFKQLLEARQWQLQNSNKRQISTQQDNDYRFYFERSITWPIMAVLLIAALGLFVLYKRKADKHKINLTLQQKNEEILAQKNEIEEKSLQIEEINGQLHTLNGHLHELIDARTTSLREAYEELDILTYRTSHDFRSPLTSLLGLAEVAHLEDRPEGFRQLFSHVENVAQRMDRMLIKLGVIYQVRHKKTQYELINWDNVIGRVLKKLEALIETNKAEIEIKQKIDIPYYSNDELLEVILYNLLENSLVFNTSGSPKVALEILILDDKLQISIADNGIGIPEGYENKIFEMFCRASNLSEGSGLGLYVVKKALEKLNGKIYLSDTKITLYHTTFVCQLPVVSAPKKSSVKRTRSVSRSST